MKQQKPPDYLFKTPRCPSTRSLPVARGRLASGLILLLVAGIAPAQTSQPLDFTAANDALGVTYVDGNEGFSISPPKGWQIARQRIPEKRSVIVLRMVGMIPPHGSQEILVKRMPASRSLTIEEMMRGVGQALELEFSNVQIQAQQVQSIAGRPGGFITADYWREGQKWLRLQALVETGPRAYLTMVYDGPAELQRTSEPMFQLVVASLKLLPDSLPDAVLRKALEEGSQWLASLREDRLGSVLIPSRYVRIQMNAKPVGFIRIHESKEVRQRRPGVVVRELGWMFQPDGRIQRTQNTLFLSNDLQEENWRNKTTTLIPSGGDQPAVLDLATEEGVRVRDLLLSNQSPSLSQPTVENPSLKLPKTYISRILLQMLPRLLGDLTRPRVLAFTAFDHDRQDLVMQIAELKGAATPTAATTAEGKVFRFDLREGAWGDPHTTDVDAKGALVASRSGAYTFTPANEKEIERDFSTRVREAERRIAELETDYQRDQERFGRRPAKP